VCATKNFSSVRLYSAPQLHRTIVAIPRICARLPPYATPASPMIAPIVAEGKPQKLSRPEPAELIANHAH
jgi:hypothetical protein